MDRNKILNRLTRERDREIDMREKRRRERERVVLVLSLFQEFRMFLNDGDKESIDVFVESCVVLLCLPQYLHHLYHTTQSVLYILHSQCTSLLHHMYYTVTHTGTRL